MSVLSIEQQRAGDVYIHPDGTLWPLFIIRPIGVPSRYMTHLISAGFGIRDKKKATAPVWVFSIGRFPKRAGHAVVSAVCSVLVFIADLLVFWRYCCGLPELYGHTSGITHPTKHHQTQYNQHTNANRTQQHTVTKHLFYTLHKTPLTVLEFDHVWPYHCELCRVPFGMFCIARS